MDTRVEGERSKSKRGDCGLITISYEDWRKENHEVLASNCLHRAIPSLEGSRCKVCGLCVDDKSGQHVSRFAKALAEELGVDVLLADSFIASGKRTKR